MRIPAEFLLEMEVALRRMETEELTAMLVFPPGKIAKKLGLKVRRNYEDHYVMEMQDPSFKNPYSVITFSQEMWMDFMIIRQTMMQVGYFPYTRTCMVFVTGNFFLFQILFIAGDIPLCLPLNYPLIANHPPEKKLKRNLTTQNITHDFANIDLQPVEDLCDLLSHNTTLELNDDNFPPLEQTQTFKFEPSESGEGSNTGNGVPLFT